MLEFVVTNPRYMIGNDTARPAMIEARLNDIDSLTTGIKLKFLSFILAL